MSRLLLGPMTADDLEQVARIERVCFSDPWSEKSLSQELANPRAVFLTAKSDEEVVGYVGMHHIVDEGHIANLAVLPAFRRQGVAAALLRSLLAYAAGHGLVLLTLEVRESNTAARRLYEGFGFVQVGRRPRYYAHPTEDALLLTLRM